MALIAEPPVAGGNSARESVGERRWRASREGGRERTEHRVKEEAVTLSDIVGELGVEELGLVSLLVTLDEDLAYPDGAAWSNPYMRLISSKRERE